MRIQSINNNLNFKGLFQDYSKENDGDWKMVYRPYSWELRDEKTPQMATKERVNIIADYLPDNEEIFTSQKGVQPETSADILGTISYYKYPPSYNLGETRKHITMGEPLTREESLKVYLNKLTKFEEMKNLKQIDLSNNIFESKKTIDDTKKSFNYFSKEYNNSFFSRNEYKNDMVRKTEDLYSIANKLHSDATDYLIIEASLNTIKKEKEAINKELQEITKAKEAGNVIDISQRHIPDPNKKLWDAIMDVLNKKSLDNTEKKLIIFPHKSITLKSLIENWFKSYDSKVFFNKDIVNRMPGEILSRTDSEIYHFKRYVQNAIKKL